MLVRELSDLDLTALRATVAASQEPFQHSQLYLVQEQQKVEDPSRRNSSFRLLVSAEVFDLVEPVIEALNRADDSGTFTLLRNDATHIVYKTGEFFARHKDYLSLTSNVVEEFSLIISLNQPGAVCEGGATLVHVNPSHTLTSVATCTAGGALLFRKDLEHEGALVTKGCKEILTLNVWRTKKAAKGVLVVTFPREDSGKCEAKKEEPRDCMLRQVAQARSYVIPFADILAFPECMLASYIACEAEPSGSTQVRFFACELFTYAEFATAFRIFSRMYVSAEELAQNRGVIQYMNLADRHILWDLAKEPGAVPTPRPELSIPALIQDLKNGTHSENEDEYFDMQQSMLEKILPGPSTFAAKWPPASVSQEEEKKKKKNKKKKEVAEEQKTASSSPSSSPSSSSSSSAPPLTSALSSPLSSSFDLIVCESPARTAAVMSTARALGYNYIPFRVLFVEGVLFWGGEMTGNAPTTLKMTPVWVSCGDYDNIFRFVRVGCPPSYFRRGDPMRDFPMWQTALQHPGSTLTLSLSESAKPDDNPAGYFKMGVDDHQTPDVYVGLEACARVPEGQLVTTIIKSVLNPGCYEWVPEQLTMLPGVSKTTESQKRKHDGSESKHAYSHVDAAGKVCFTLKEAQALSQRLVELDFTECVRAHINTTPLHFSQEARVDHSFCNETVYGKLNVIMMTGVFSP